ncbi:MAG: response regulator transcription factor [Bdellovibrio sp.]|nr:response regulator transcription factor [Bdellovibrio sp.]
MRILLADDHAIVRSGLKRIIMEAFPDVPIGEAASDVELLAKMREANWTVLILDIALGTRNGLDLVPELLQIIPDLRIIILSMYSERQFVVRALRVGVSGYVTKDRAPEELLQAISSVTQGKRYICETATQQIAEHVALADFGSQAPHERLSSREYEVFLLLAKAHSVTEIATQLRLSVKTISTYRNRILEKMGLNSNAQLMRYALESKLTT